MTPLPTLPKNTHTFSRATCCCTRNDATVSWVLTPITLASALLSSELRVARNACRHTSELCCDISTKPCDLSSQVAASDSSNLVKKTLTDMLWGDAVIGGDRQCSAGLYEDYKDKQWGAEANYFYNDQVNSINVYLYVLYLIFTPNLYILHINYSWYKLEG